MTLSPNTAIRTGLVAIGRNEGERLRRCLISAQGIYDHVVYVDSGSTDDSVALAESFGAVVVVLDTERPFTAARARNAGFARLREIEPDLDCVQFVDGDCEIVRDWPGTALEALDARDDVAVVCGRRRERAPDQSAYNLLCDMEWDTPAGEAAACGGDSLMRARAFSETGGFRDDLIAGEEPELCFRLREKGWKILRVDADMTLHDAAMTRFSQWWRRAMRSGHAYAEGYALHGQSPERFNARDVRSILFWGAGLPIITLLVAVTLTPWGLLLLLGYPVLFWRIWRYRRSRGASGKEARLYAAYCVLGKFAEFTGVWRYWTGRLRNRKPELIEYKGRFSDQS